MRTPRSPTTRRSASSATRAFSHTAGELQAKAFGANTLVLGDLDGNGRADFHILLSGAVALQATDFLL